MINDHKTEGRLKLHSGNTVTDYKTKGEWEIQLSMAINFISSKDSNEIHIMPRKSDNIHIMMGSVTDEMIEELFKSNLQSISLYK